jgi:hypothetical protein
VDPDVAALIHFLDAQRASVLAIVDGLDEESLRATILPSGWSPLGLIEHLGDAERFWFQKVATGTAGDRPWRDEDGDASTVARRRPQAVFAYYQDQCQRSNAVLASTPLSSPPVSQHGLDLEDDVKDLRWIALHMIEETARHAGHLDVVRELLDGRTGLGPR